MYCSLMKDDWNKQSLNLNTCDKAQGSQNDVRTYSYKQFNIIGAHEVLARLSLFNKNI